MLSDFKHFKNAENLIWLMVLFQNKETGFSIKAIVVLKLAFYKTEINAIDSRSFFFRVGRDLTLKKALAELKKIFFNKKHILRPLLN
jgi:hypothetical protein